MLTLRLEPSNASFILGIEDIWVGRDETCDIVLDDRSVSSKHLRFHYRDGGHYVQDLGSTNGTFINGTRILEAKLHALDRIQIGAVSIVVCMDGLTKYE